MSRLIVACLLSLATLVASCEELYQEGKHYQLLVTPIPVEKPGKVEVVELFWYGCPHCFHFEPIINKWLKQKPADVVFRRIPAVFAENWVPHARAFYAAEALGIMSTFHPALFKAMHEEGQQISDEAGMVRFAVLQGINEAQFKAAYNGFSIDGKVKQAMRYTRDSGITGVPSIIVNGKYRTGAQLAGGSDEVLKVIDFLVARERAR